MHGAKSPQALRSAKERLREMVEPALAALLQVIENGEANDNAKVKACVAILDRTGYGPRSELAVEDTTQRVDWSKVPDDVLAALIESQDSAEPRVVQPLRHPVPADDDDEEVL